MRILLIEEDAFALSLLTRKLKESFNCSVDQVQFSHKALRLLKTEKPYDFIISDYLFPGCLGVEIKEFKDRHLIPGQFVFYTNNQNFRLNADVSSLAVVSRVSFEELHQFVLLNFKKF